MSRLYIIPLLLLYTQPVFSMTKIFKRADPVFLAMVCQDECEVHVRFLETLPQPNDNHTHGPFELTMHSVNGSFYETKMEVPEDVSVLEFVYFPVEDENGTTTQETDIWDLNFSETYFHSSGNNLQVVGNLPCGKYGCPQSPLCDGGCRFTVIVSLAAFCLSILAGLILQTVYVSFLGFRKTRKQLELRDTLRLTESAEQSH